MSDYIGNLVTKHLNPRAVLQPRLASHFEPLKPLASLASERQFDDTSFDEAVLQDEATFAVRKPIEPEVKPRLASEIARPTIENSPAESAPPARSVPHIPTPSSDAPIGPRRLSPALHPSELQSQAEEVNEAVDAPRRPAQDHHKAIQSGLPLIEQTVTRARQPDRTADAPDRSISEPVVRHVIETVHQRPAITPSTQPVAPHDGRQILEPLRESAPRANLRPAITVTRLAPPVEPPQPASPTIHVTIGRIEVRATTTTPTSKQRPAPAVMSLDDYLKRREGERP